MAKRTGPSAVVVDMVWQRDNGSCARCGTGLNFALRGTQWSLHHRRPRGMGGTKEAWVNQPANLVPLCGTGVTGCHSWVESHRQDARDLGWLVPRNAVYKAEDVALTYWDGVLYLLDDYGGRRAEHETGNE